MNKQLKVKTRSNKRLGRGYGSGKGGHTSSRGTKGQKARSKVGILFEGMKLKKSLLRRLPITRGKGKFVAHPKPVIVKLESLNVFNDGAKVNIESLVKQGLVKEKEMGRGAKILGNGKLAKKLEVCVFTSEKAAKLIEKAGGKVVIV